MVIDWGLLFSAAGLLFLLGAAFLKNYVSIAATNARSLANEDRIRTLEGDLHAHQISTISTYVTNSTLKEAMGMFGAAVDRLTDRLDKIIMDRGVPD